MMMRILIWAVLIGSIVMGLIGVQTGSVINAAIGIGVLILGAFIVFFLFKMFLHFGFFMVKILLIIGLIALIIVGGIKGCTHLTTESAPSKDPTPTSEPILMIGDENLPPPSLWQRAKKILFFNQDSESLQPTSKRVQVQSPLPTKISGIVTSVQSGYLFKIDDHFIKLYGIDTPDPKQKCLDARRNRYDCGKQSKMMLERLIEGRNLSCQIAGGDYRENFIATCQIRNTDIGVAMVSAGWAVADRAVTDVYIPYEEQAHRKKAGLWAGKFVAPWEARAPKSQPVRQQKSEESFWGKLFQ